VHLDLDEDRLIDRGKVPVRRHKARALVVGGRGWDRFIDVDHPDGHRGNRKPGAVTVVGPVVPKSDVGRGGPHVRVVRGTDKIIPRGERIKREGVDRVPLLVVRVGVHIFVVVLPLAPDLYPRNEIPVVPGNGKGPCLRGRRCQPSGSGNTDGDVTKVSPSLGVVRPVLIDTPPADIGVPLPRGLDPELTV